MTKVESKKALLLEAGLDAFFEKGFDNTTIDAIVKRAGCGKGTFYKYFPGKEALLEELENDFNSTLGQELKKHCKPELPLRDYLVSGAMTFVDVFKTHQRLGLVKFEHENRLNPDRRHAAVCRVMPNLFYMQGFIENAIKNNELRQIKPEMLIVTILGACHFLLFRDYKMGIPVQKHEIESIVDLVLSGALAR